MHTMPFTRINRPDERPYFRKDLRLSMHAYAGDRTTRRGRQRDGFYHAGNLFSHVRFASNQRVQLRLDFIWREAKPTEVHAGHENLMVPSLAHGA